MLDFLSFGFIDVIDILLVAFLLYNLYKLLKGTVAINIFIGVAIIFLIYFTTKALQMEMLSSLLGNLISGGAIALMIIFHPEIRKFLLMLGSAKFKSQKGFMKQLKFINQKVDTEVEVKVLLNAVKKFRNHKIGALIVVERSNSLEFLKEKGDVMDIVINVPILESIFYKNSPLHDGAVILQQNKIIATRVVLPLSDKKIPGKYGLRHRSAIGISERTDAICLVVSEETGNISLINDGEFVFFDSLEMLEAKLNQYLK